MPARSFLVLLVILLVCAATTDKRRPRDDRNDDEEEDDSQVLDGRMPHVSVALGVIMRHNRRHNRRITKNCALNAALHCKKYWHHRKELINCKEEYIRSNKKRCGNADRNFRI